MADPIDPVHRAKMNAVMYALAGGFPDCAIVLLVAPFSGPEGGRVNYISNAERTNMVAMMRELLARWEGQPTGKAGHA